MFGIDGGYRKFLRIEKEQEQRENKMQVVDKRCKKNKKRKNWQNDNDIWQGKKRFNYRE